jgi:hypothetical protein
VAWSYTAELGWLAKAMRKITMATSAAKVGPPPEAADVWQSTYAKASVDTLLSFAAQGGAVEKTRTSTGCPTSTSS